MAEHQQTQQPRKTDNTSQKQTITPKQIPTSHPAAIIQRARINPKSLTHADVLQLQRTIGNRAVGRLLSEIELIPSRTKQTPPVQMQTITKEDEEPLQGKTIETIQRRESEEEEKLQMKSVVQRQDKPEEEEPLQGKFENETEQVTCSSCSPFPIQQKKENLTGMPDGLKTGVENLSGIDMSDVRVHYNSDKPAEVGALAYTQGTEIHVAPGQERHLPHETWHVVQQAQGRVQPTMQLKDVAVNDDAGLEKEADAMGENIISNRSSDLIFRINTSQITAPRRSNQWGTAVMQLSKELKCTATVNVLAGRQYQADGKNDEKSRPAVGNLLNNQSQTHAIFNNMQQAPGGMPMYACAEPTSLAKTISQMHDAGEYSPIQQVTVTKAIYVKNTDDGLHHINELKDACATCQQWLVPQNDNYQAAIPQVQGPIWIQSGARPVPPEKLN